MRALIEPIAELPGALVLRCEQVRVHDQDSADEWARVREQAFAEQRRLVDVLFDLSGFVLDPNGIQFWGRAEREFMAKHASNVVRFGRSPESITHTLIEVAGQRYGFPGNLVDDYGCARELLQVLRGAADDCP